MQNSPKENAQNRYSEQQRLEARALECWQLNWQNKATSDTHMKPTWLTLRPVLEQKTLPLAYSSSCLFLSPVSSLSGQWWNYLSALLTRRKYPQIALNIQRNSAALVTIILLKQQVDCKAQCWQVAQQSCGVRRCLEMARTHWCLWNWSCCFNQSVFQSTFIPFWSWLWSSSLLPLTTFGTHHKPIIAHLQLNNRCVCVCKSNKHSLLNYSRANKTRRNK